MIILYITQNLPYPQDGGGKIKTFSTISLLKKLGHKVILFCFVDKTERLEYVNQLRNEGFKVEKIVVNSYISGYRPRIFKILKFIQSFFSLKPFSIFKYYKKEMESAVDEFIIRNKIDCLWIDHLSMAQYLPRSYSGLKILELHNIDSLFFKRMMLEDTFLYQKIFAFIEWIKFSIYEKNTYPTFTKIYSISEFDKNIIQKIYKINTEVLPLVIKPDDKKTSSEKMENTIAYVGNLCWYPNKDGIYWFLDKVYPLILKRISNIQFLVIGNFPQRNIFPKQRNVKFLGYKKNIESYLTKIKVFVVPIRYGSGLRIKILKAMSWGLPIVSTYEAAEGLNVTDGKEILLARDEVELAEKIILLFRERKLRENLIKNSTRFLLRNYSYKDLAIFL